MGCEIVHDVGSTRLFEAGIVSINCCGESDYCAGGILVKERGWGWCWNGTIAPDRYPDFDMFDVVEEMLAFLEEVGYFP